MITESYDPEQFYNLIWDAIQTPDTADCNSLLIVSNGVLDTIHEGDPVLVPMVRALAEAAMYWAVFHRHHEVWRVRAHDFYKAFAEIHPADA
jgi:hypothetical protein